jgi:hypothetical protein
MIKQRAAWVVAICLGLAGSAMGQIAFDEGANYSGGWTNGSNGGNGFEAWVLTADGGAVGYGGHFVGDPATASITGMATNSFGLAANGDAAAFSQADRNFSAPLNVGETFSFQWGINWDSGDGGGNKGFNLYAGGAGSNQLFNVNNAGSSDITLNGSNIGFGYGTNVMTWSIAAVSPNELLISANDRDGDGSFATNVLVAALPDAMRLYASNLQVGDVAQPYFDQFLVETNAALDLFFAAGEGAPTVTGDYEYILRRDPSVVTNDLVVLSGSDTNLVTLPANVSFASSNAVEVAFTATVNNVNGGSFTLVASNAAATAAYTIVPQAPTLVFTSGTFAPAALGTYSYSLQRSGDVADTVELSSSDTNLLTVPATVTFSNAATSVSFDAELVGFGSVTITATDTNSGATAEFVINAIEPALTVSGPERVFIGQPRVFTLRRAGAVGDTVSLSSSAPAVLAVTNEVVFGAEDNRIFFVAAGVTGGVAQLTASAGSVTSALFEVTVEPLPELAAYDDAGLYGTNGWVLTPTNSIGFGGWTLTSTTANASSFAGTFIEAAPIQGINEGGQAFGLFANYSGDQPDPLPEVKVSRAFPAALVPGQTFSVDLGYNFSGGNKGVKLKGTFETNVFDRFELYSAGGDTWNYKIRDQDPETAWSGYIDGGFVGNLLVTYEANGLYTIRMQREGEAAVVLTDVDLFGSIDQVEFYNFNGGQGEAENLYVNRMWISAAPDQPVGPEISGFSFTSGQPQVALSGVAGTSYTLVYTTNLLEISTVTPPELSEWVAVTSQVPSADGPVLLLDTNALTDAARFYGVLTGPLD